MLSGGRRNGGIRASSNVGGDWLPLHFQKTETSKTDPPRSFSERYSFSTETSVALIIAKTVSPSLRFIRFTEPVVIIEVTSPALVWMTTSDTTLSETIFSIVPRKRFRMLVLMVYRDSCLGLLEGLACRSTTCDESFMSVTIKNR